MDLQSPWFVICEDTVLLDRGNYTTCTVNLQGATVTSWRIQNKEMLYVAHQADFTGLRHIVGGIQFVFPIMGEWSFGPRHGFARKSRWKLVQGPEKLPSEDICATFSLMYNEYTLSLWHFKFELLYKITLYEKRIDFQISVENWDARYAMEFVIVQHCWWRLDDIHKCKIKGLRNCQYKDFLKQNQVAREYRDEVTIRQQTNRVYYRTPNKLVVEDTVAGGSLNLLRKNGRDVVVWNPWIEETLMVNNLGT
ncbi:hypothetical protein NQ315_003031 [Exocentrus adspersus]|uniref:Galactose mutarotase n=1 Tax=Exocentrus adspersus TaxID=1586481 RepID=A0AAV8W422_9CUCU|nr:hypothetical protein NQ315_003031 [Exocentrus adspersus]